MNGSRCQLPLLQSTRGSALIIMMLILFMASMAVILKGLGNRSSSREHEKVVTIKALMKAKESVIAFAVMYPDYFPAGAGVGHLMCPDTDPPAFAASGAPLAPYGLPNDPCGPDAIGRLPHFVTLPSGDPFPISDFGAGYDQQFWYAVSDAFLANPNSGVSNVLNSTTSGSLSLDGQSDVVAVLLVPGQALEGQIRQTTTPAAYLEKENISGPVFVSGWPAAPDGFNDRIVAIRRTELLLPMTARVVEEMKKHLDAYHEAGGVYPTDQAAFTASFAAAPPWLTSNNWLLGTTTTYTPLSGDSATLLFSGCGITYTLTFGSSVVGRSQTDC